MVSCNSGDGCRTTGSWGSVAAIVPYAGSYTIAPGAPIAAVYDQPPGALFGVPLTLYFVGTSGDLYAARADLAGWKAGRLTQGGEFPTNGRAFVAALARYDVITGLYGEEVFAADNHGVIHHLTVGPFYDPSAMLGGDFVIPGDVGHAGDADRRGRPRPGRPGHLRGRQLRGGAVVLVEPVHRRQLAHGVAAAHARRDHGRGRRGRGVWETSISPRQVLASDPSLGALFQGKTDGVSAPVAPECDQVVSLWVGRRIRTARPEHVVANDRSGPSATQMPRTPSGSPLADGRG